ncbi:hypothetical protein P7C73_g990, partial [Tremellales sp. Uapishka_1]
MPRELSTSRNPSRAERTAKCGSDSSFSQPVIREDRQPPGTDFTDLTSYGAAPLKFHWPSDLQSNVTCHSVNLGGGHACSNIVITYTSLLKSSSEAAVYQLTKEGASRFLSSICNKIFKEDWIWSPKGNLADYRVGSIDDSLTTASKEFLEAGCGDSYIQPYESRADMVPDMLDFDAHNLTHESGSISANVTLNLFPSRIGGTLPQGRIIGEVPDPQDGGDLTRYLAGE